MKVGIIAIAKCENLYLKEWIDYHLGLGFDQIIIGLNDDEFKPPVINPRVRYENWAGVSPLQVKAYTAMYKKFQHYFDWLLFIDIDEFLVLEKEMNVKDFLKDFKNDIIRVSSKHFTDSNMLDVVDGDYSVFKRFTEVSEGGDNTFVKSFINTRIELGEMKVYGHGIYDDSLDAVNVLGQPCENKDPHVKNIVHKRCWLNHYRTKTIGEYIRQKYTRGGANNNAIRYTRWETYFFKTNRKTQEKIDYANKLIKEIEK
jgi:hypothetical protein